jgi:tetratricopeptide (TPR) repeat protein
MSSHGWLTTAGFAIATICATGSFGCAAPQSKMQRGIEVMQAESAPDQLAGRGDSFAAVGDMTRAEQYFVAALRSGGEPAPLVRRLIAVCVADGRYPVALEYAEEYLRKHPSDVDVRYAAATLRVAIGDEKRAREELLRVLAARPSFADAHYAIALLDKDKGDVMAADAEFRAYLASAPDGEHAEVARANLMRTIP